MEANWLLEIRLPNITRPKGCSEDSPMASNTQRLRVIRSRTDHDLLILIQRELDRGFALVNVAASRNSAHFARAQEAQETAKSLLPKISFPDDQDRLRMEAKLKELRSRLEQVPAYANLRAYPASVAS
jgi:hypothetical protein